MTFGLFSPLLPFASLPWLQCNLLFGWSIRSYRTLCSAAVTIVGLLVGDFNYDTVLNLDPVLAALLIPTSIVSMLYVLTNLLVSALLTTFGEERAAAMASQEESMIQLMCRKLAALLGLKQQPWPEPLQGGAAQRAGPG
nr:polycystic kidney disease protein 1-like 3 [Pelodiscus sinensis]|eukprot:XP_014428135.1 polycystic kidney disease protein 1-like 3 [Pelodiscus sinensis]